MNTITSLQDNPARVAQYPNYQEDNTMAFVNEFISAADIEKYGIKEIDEKFNKGHYKPHWTIDRERNIYLRYLYNEREEHSNRHTYFFYWKGSSVIVIVDIDGGGVMNGEQWRHYNMWRLEIPESIKPQEREVIGDLKHAFVTYKEAGVLSDSTKHTATFDF